MRRKEFKDDYDEGPEEAQRTRLSRVLVLLETGRRC